MRRLPAQHFLPGPGDNIEFFPRQFHREHGGGRIANGEALAVLGDPVTVRHPHAGGRAVPGEDDIAGPVGRGKVGNFAIAGGNHLGIFKLELLDDIRRPTRTEAFPRQHGDGTRTQQRPERHLYRASVRARHDTDLVVIGNAEQRALSIDHRFQSRLAFARAMGPAKKRIFKILEGPSGALCAGAG